MPKKWEQICHYSIWCPDFYMVQTHSTFLWNGNKDKTRHKPGTAFISSVFHTKTLPGRVAQEYLAAHLGIFFIPVSDATHN